MYRLRLPSLVFLLVYLCLLRLPSPLSFPRTSTHKHLGNVLARKSIRSRSKEDVVDHRFRSSGVADDGEREDEERN